MKTQTINFTKKAIASFPIPTKEENQVVYYDSGSKDGLCLIVSYGGSKTFYAYMKYQGMPKRIKIGKFGHVELETARRKAHTMRERAICGEDPAQERFDELHDMTLKEYYEKVYLPVHSLTHKKQKTQINDNATFRNHLSVFHNRQMRTISRDEVARHHNFLRQTVSSYTANRMLALIRHMYNKAYECGFPKRFENPADGIKMFREISRDRFLRDDELKRLFDALNNEPNDVFKNYVLISLADYNAVFGTNFDTSAAKFSNYYKDLSRRIKDREVDLTIVVNMFLTGFDAKTLNTLWVDKNLRQHGLLQAFSRTNRILNSVKTHGNIVCFRNLERATNECIALFGDKDAAGLVLLKPYNEYYYGYEKNGAHVSGYSDLISELTDKYKIGTVLASEVAKKDFVRLYGAILRVKNILVSFDEFVGNEILSPRQFQDYQSMYIALYNEMRPARGSVENVNDDLVFEMELIKSVDVNIDYILTLISRYHASHMTDKEILITINKTIDSSIELRSKKDLILQFIASLTPDSVVERDWVAFINSAKIAELDQIIADEHLNREETYKFVQNAFRDGYVQTNGMDIGKILPPMSMFDRNNNRAKKKKTVIEKIIAFFERFFSISE